MLVWIVVHFVRSGWIEEQYWLVALVDTIAPNAMERKGAAKPLVALHVLCIGIKPRTQPLGPSSPYGVGTGA